MPQVTVEVSQAAMRDMETHPQINWPIVFHRAIEREARAAELIAHILKAWSDPRFVSFRTQRQPRRRR